MSAFPSSLYIHIPFCSSICAYCDFAKVLYRPEWAKAYLGALFVELESRVGRHRFQTIYVGGGTPSALSCKEMETLLAKIGPLLEKGGEFTVEANPESLDDEKCALLKKYGVNRVSLGVESSQERFLRLMGRPHDFAQAEKAVEALRENGIDNINVDLIYALPGQTMEDLEKDLKAFLGLKVPHISAYTLILEEATAFKAQGYQEADEETQAAMYEKVLETLRKAGYDRYEVSNFALPGHRSRHNLTYWKDETYVGVGLGAAGYADGIRYSNSRSLTKYLKGGDPTEEKEVVDQPSDLSYFLLCNLRLEEGFLEETFEKRFGNKFIEIFPKASELAEQGLLCLDSGRIRCTDKGMLLLDRVLVELG